MSWGPHYFPKMPHATIIQFHNYSHTSSIHIPHHQKPKSTKSTWTKADSVKSVLMELAAAIHWKGNVKIWLQSEHWTTSAMWRMWTWTWDGMRWWVKMSANRWWRTRGTSIANNACDWWRQEYLRQWWHQRRWVQEEATLVKNNIHDQ